jgi:hypothetical protein
MSYTQVTGMSSTRYPLKGLGCGCSSTAAPMSGLGQTATTTGFGPTREQMNDISRPVPLAVGFVAGALAMHLMHRSKIMKNRRRRHR